MTLRNALTVFIKGKRQAIRLAVLGVIFITYTDMISNLLPFRETFEPGVLRGILWFIGTMFAMLKLLAANWRRERDKTRQAEIEVLNTSRAATRIDMMRSRYRLPQMFL
ncbi:MAG: hypothetical protein A3D53_01770 [Candidatus Magasanikbacteria bacterium RIFCSPHIGHO2_02_FULL_45_10]|uniref:Uncharacterized protein n=1 Tax=Candidatus Magasanikbacteria bacterium RIFCSPHIGHO2_02_FULL_45_10 TaxID=1798679 RepID=A0A1F6MC63_9BACT|nr:MAG: hypothetical protein A3D53_01770 [Candidatus Magasanikbacteria bacterium RIFCSPHIGHO2_02_FULL_45_10]